MIDHVALGCVSPEKVVNIVDKLMVLFQPFFLLGVNALLGCHDLDLSCCREIAGISVMECSI